MLWMKFSDFGAAVIQAVKFRCYLNAKCRIYQAQNTHESQ